MSLSVCSEVVRKLIPLNFALTFSINCCRVVLGRFLSQSLIFFIVFDCTTCVGTPICMSPIFLMRPVKIIPNINYMTNIHHIDRYRLHPHTQISTRAVVYNRLPCLSCIWKINDDSNQLTQEYTLEMHFSTGHVHSTDRFESAGQ